MEHRPLTGLVPVIHVVKQSHFSRKTWMPGTGGLFSRRWSGGLAAAALNDLPQRFDADAVTEIAKTFLADARGGPQREERIERLGEPGDVEPFGDQLVEPGPFEIAADIERIISGHAADDADIAGIGPRAAIRAAGDANAEPLALEAPAPQSRGDGIDDVAAHPLRFGQCEAAAR